MSALDFADVLAIAPTFAVAGAICASGSLVLARRAGMRELPGNRVDAVEAEHTDYEYRKLL